ncbi:MAG: YicC family protein [Peptococcaceae bacterium]|nr:YicC family protein [Peptococcaceae bacterium]
MRSMTGYGRGEGDNGALKIVVEVKAVNHRYSEITIKQPRLFLALEDKMKKVIGEYIERGKVDVFVRTQELADAEKPVQIDQQRALAYHQALQQLAATVGGSYTPDPYRLMTLPDVILKEENEPDVKALWPLMEQVLRQAMENHVAMREQEGAHIGENLREKVAGLQKLAAQVTERSPQILVEYKEKLEGRIAELLANAAVDPERLAQEVAYFAEKSCIDEELVRLQSHFEQFYIIADQTGSIGRKLDFLIQEMNRETNTIGSKANDLETGRLVVEMKSELEKVREQVQNIE